MIRTISAVTIGLFLVAQGFQPDRSVPAHDPAQDLLTITKADGAMVALIKNACYDCHSYKTEYPWYAYITPVNWWVQSSHIDDARHHLNFSDWGSYGDDDRRELAEEAAEVIAEGEMPLPSFIWLHTEADLSAAQREKLISWFNRIQGH